MLGHIFQIQTILAHCNLAHFASKIFFCNKFENRIYRVIDVKAIDSLFYYLFRL